MLKLIRPKLLSAFLLIGSLFTLHGGEAHAQRWLQTSQLLIDDFENNSPPRVLLDTLNQVLSRNDSILVRREPGGEKMKLSEVKNEVINAGFAFTSANRVFINYKFEIKNRGFEESIESLKYIYRPPGDAAEDIPFLYIDATKQWVKDILRNKGTTLATNQAALKTFSDQLAFARMAENGQVVQIAGNTVREGYEREKRQLVQKIQRLTYGSM